MAADGEDWQNYLAIYTTAIHEDRHVHSRRVITAAFTAVVTAATALAQEPARMEEVVRSHVANNQFTGAVLVARGGEILLSKGYGSANLEWDIPAAPSTRFRIGSVTKQFTAAAVLLLEERGKLSLTDPVRKHVPDAPAAWEKVTISTC
jgi:CubicO group peptidase (beta-lactamase class C family)